MAVRTTISAVQKIIVYDTVQIPDLTPFIASASLLVDEVVAIAPSPSAGILEVVERYLTAHLVAITDPRTASEQVRSLQQSFQYKLGMGLALTHHGSMAMLLDTSGRLARWNTRAVDGAGGLQFFWSGEEA